MGLYNAELFNNLGLCCFYAQHFDMVISCFERALSLAINENAADVWYNIGHVAIVRIPYPYELRHILMIHHYAGTYSFEVVHGLDLFIIGCR